MLFTRMESILYDVRFATLPPQRSRDFNLIIIDIDEQSIQQEGRWPWPRLKVARLLEQLQNNGVALIGMDVIFSEPEINPVQIIVDSTPLDKALLEQLLQLSPSLDADSQLAAVTEENTVLGYFFQSSGNSSGELPFPFHQMETNELERSAIFSMPSYTASTPLLASQALDQGFVVAIPDADGTMRRLPLVIRHENNLYASLSLVMARLTLNAHWVRLDTASNGRQQVATSINLGGKLHIPVSEDGSVLIPYRGPAGSFSIIPATRILNNQLSEPEKRQLDGAIILVGSSALGLSDLHTTPLQTLYPGVEAHANVLDAILHASEGENSFYHQPDWAPAAALTILLLTGGLLAFLLPGRSLSGLLFLSLSGVCLVVGLNFWLWHNLHLALPLVFSLTTCLLLAALHMLGGFAVSSHKKHKIQQLFGTYVPPDYVRLLLHNPKQASMEGEQREMTVLFADICGFTRLSEALTTAQLKQMLNHYLTAVTEVIFERQGTIDKYVGDMVMAFWNAPLEDDKHASHGVQTALAMLECVERLKPVFAEKGWPALRIGVGLNTGPMNVGDMGSNYRRAYTVLGDAVNLGSRLESLTRYYGVGCLVSDYTRSQCPDILFRPVDRVRVVGKDEALDIFEPVAPQAGCSPEQQQLVDEFTQALALYRQQRFIEAASLLAHLESRDPEHRTLYQCYQKRIQEFLLAPPPGDWQAIHAHTSK